MKQDGGPAFPHKGSVDFKGVGVANIQFPAPGMSLRDYFAAGALTGIASLSKGAYGNDSEIAERFAVLCYRLADAMIAERERG